MQKIIYIVSILSLSLLTHCAKKRPVEKVYDLAGNRWPKAVFDKEEPWLYKVTIVKNSQNPGFGFVGLQSGVQMGYFKFTQDQLQFISARDIYEESQNADEIINAWSISHSDYHRPVVGGKISNQQAENDRINWKVKRFFKVQWDNAKISEQSSFPFQIDTSCWQKKTTRLVDDSQEIKPEHVSFTLAVDYQIQEKCIGARDYYNKDYTHTIHYKYSFMPDLDSDYKPYVYAGENDPLMKKYGYFNTVVPQLNGEDRVQNHFVMNRWDPNKTHTFYFAEDFPEEYKWIYTDPEKGVIAQTNKLFAENDIPTRFEIKENDGSKKFGDIRYSFIKFVEEKDATSPLGYGPSDAHPLTGEIFAANTIMWTADLKAYVRIYKEEYERQPDKFKSSSIYRQMEQTITQEPETWTDTANFLQDRTLSKFYRFLVPEFTYGGSGSAFANKEDDMAPKMMTQKTAEKFSETHPGFVEVNQTITESAKAIEKQLDYYRHMNHFSQSNSTIYHLADEVLVGAGRRLQGEATPEQVVNDILYRTAIHEFGHNLNLRHNFYGSVDAHIQRQPGDDTGNQSRGTSSVMDYLSISDEIGLKHDWEIYDKAALLYAYSDGSKDLSRENNQLYLYCTDQHRAYNALCNAFDHGASPSEILVSLVDNYDQGYWRRNFRWDRAYWNARAYNGRVFGTMFDIKKFVKMYQETFTPNQVMQELSNIQGASPQLANSISAFIRSDITQAVKLAAGFYSSVIKQGFLDRPYTDSYDEFQGTLKQVGIFPDKYFASLFLLGDDAFPLNPNNGMIPVSFIPIRDDPSIGPLIDEILFDTFVNSGDAYNGFDNLGRAIYAQNAGRYFDFEGEQGAIDLMKLVCYKKSSINERFGVDPDDPNGDGEPLQLEVITPDFQNATNPDPYFSEPISETQPTPETEVAMVKINGQYYAAGMERNPYSAALITQADLNGVLNGHLFYNQITGRDGQQCQ